MTAVLCARKDSVYKSIIMLDVYDIERDAFTFNGGQRVIAHPPCRSWGRLRTFAKPRPDEQDLARFCVQQVRQNGGVLEHPASSTLWDDMHMSKDHRPDHFGGWTLPISQRWFGHKAEKLTWLYVVGTKPSQVPPIPLDLSYATHVVENSSKSSRKLPTITKSEREETPIDLAYFLIEIAELSTIPLRAAS
jgi:hypothetical protein